MKNILTNANYIGKVRHFIDKPEDYVELEGLHEPIISQTLFAEAARLIAKNKAVSRTKRPAEHNYFLGFLYCAKCGSKLRSHNRRTRLKDGSFSCHGSYRCQNHTVNGGCEMGGDIGHKKVEAAFLAYMDQIADFTIADEIERADTSCTVGGKDRLIQEYHGKLKSLDKCSRKMMDACCDGGIDFDTYRQMKNKFDADRELISGELAALEKESEPEEALSRADMITSLRENWLFLTNEEKRQFLLFFVDRMIVEKIDRDDVRCAKANITGMTFSN